MPKEPKPVDKLTKPELLALVKRLHKRVTRLEGQIAASMAQPATYKPGPYDVVHVTQGPDTVSELVPPFCPLCDVNTKPPNCEVEGCPNATRDEWEREMPKPAFPWEKD